MDSHTLERMVGSEGVIRRAAELGYRMMLKGSFVSRQYFKDPAMRIPNDLDWLYLLPIEDVENARATFDDWAIKVTEMNMEAIDGVTFRSFRENAFWRQIDYAMAEDFPTINTDFAFYIDDKKIDHSISLDISFNLELNDASVPLLYTPLHGKPFTIAETPSLSTQIAWKLHQTIVRPRFKDIFDLTHMLAHPSYNETMREKTIEALLDECRMGHVKPARITSLFKHKLADLYPAGSPENSWAFWRHNHPKDLYSRSYPGNFAEGCHWHITTSENVPERHDVFNKQFYDALDKAGLTIEQITHRPYMSGL